MPGQKGFSISTSNDDTSVEPQMPADAKAADINMVVFMKDQGPVGCSGAYHLLAQGYTVESSWDWFHRVKNDIFLAAKRRGGGSWQSLQDNAGDVHGHGHQLQPVRFW